MFITTDELKDYIGVNTDNDTLLDIYNETGKDLIINYIGYDPVSGYYDELFSGNDDKVIRLNTKPITSISALTIDDELITEENYIFINEYLYLLNGLIFTKGRYNVRVEYEGGYDEIPSLIKMTNLRLSALLYTEEGGNIGITSKSFDNSGTRTFIQNTNYNKYLSVLNKYRITGI